MRLNPVREIDGRLWVGVGCYLTPAGVQFHGTFKRKIKGGSWGARFIDSRDSRHGCPVPEELAPEMRAAAEEALTFYTNRAREAQVQADRYAEWLTDADRCQYRNEDGERCILAGHEQDILNVHKFVV